MTEDSSKRSLLRIGVDTGGTFTDVVGLGEGVLRTWKIPSTPEGYEKAVLEGALAVSEGGAAQLVHSTTVATNALLERKGSRCALVTTRGFRDVLEIARQNRPDLYDLTPRKPEPLIPRDLRFEVTERVDPDDGVVTPLDRSELPALVEQLRQKGVESVAVVLLYSFLHPDHEVAVGRELQEAGFTVCLSHEVLPELREYERSSTTAANAYVQPALETYLSTLDEGALQHRLAPLQIVQSDGGVLPPKTAGAHAVRSLLSGPAAGLEGALHVARQASGNQEPQLITFDMGGTSTDVSLLDGGIRLSTEMNMGGLPVGVSMVDVHTVGAGGGSIASVDDGGALRVGPESAGAHPGPACYGRGAEATVTDAHVVLGHLRPEYFLQSRMTLQVERSHEVLERLGRDMGGVSAAEAARGVLTLVNTHMENAIRVISVQRGFSPADFTLAGFGGAGGLHVFALAEALDMTRVLVPVHPGVLSALGAVTAPWRREISRTVMRAWDPDDLPAIDQRVEGLTHQLRKTLMDDGMELEGWTFTPALDMRYTGQSFELTVPVDSSELQEAGPAFHALHKSRYGHADASAPVEVVTVRIRAESPRPQCSLPSWPSREEGDEMPRPLHGVVERQHLKAGDVVRGPVVIVEDFHTVVLPAGWAVTPDRVGNLVGTRTGEDDA